ncbi:UNVERIFIED_CONTAM: hypothetical protein RMT77_010706 [Armadillidium vulgare]
MSVEKIIKSPGVPLTVPEGSFLKTLFKDANKWMTKHAIECCESGVTYTYSELLDQIKNWSEFLKSLDLDHQDSVTIISPNCLQYVPILLGTISLGIPVLPLKIKLSPDEMRRMILNIGSKFIVFSREIEETISLALKEDISKFQLFCIGNPLKLKAQNVDHILYMSEFISLSLPSQINGEETALILFSSGTTATPKPIEISHNALSNFLYSFYNPYHDLSWQPKGLEQSIYMGMFPYFSHISGIFMLSIGLFVGGKFVIFPKYSQDAFIDGIRKYKVSHILVFLTILNSMTISPRCNEETIQSLNTLYCGGDYVPRSSIEAFRTKFNLNIDIIQIYGMTETMIVTGMPRRCKDFEGCGRLLSNVEAKIICTVTGQTLGPKQTGEICIKSPSVMKGYFKNQEATDNTLKNGWICTGDIGYYDEEEFFYVTDRLKNIIKVDVCQVSSTEIENELQQHPLVEECCVIGKPDLEHGEVPLAFVIAKEEVSEEELQNFMKDKLSDFKQLKGGIKFVQTLPKTENGKILKRELKLMI